MQLLDIHLNIVMDGPNPLNRTWMDPTHWTEHVSNIIEVFSWWINPCHIHSWMQMSGNNLLHQVYKFAELNHGGSLFSTSMVKLNTIQCYTFLYTAGSSECKFMLFLLNSVIKCFIPGCVTDRKNAISPSLLKVSALLGIGPVTPWLKLEKRNY